MRDYEEYWLESAVHNQSVMFDALLRTFYCQRVFFVADDHSVVTILAIGSLYSVCALPTESSGASAHSAYFRRAMLAAATFGTEHSIEAVHLLLTQSFYLLATCQTDRTWLTLGLAVRLGQSIGLHVEALQAKTAPQVTRIQQERRRRTWYSLFVLDRLLSLQLGRPSAIRSEDCSTSLPSRVTDKDFDLEADYIPQTNDLDPHRGDYFISVIKLSKIIGQVQRDVYRPLQEDYSEDMLDRTDQLDAQLLKWRAGLPNWLRFDRGHTFEQSAVLKRQRNMLAVKFHHLRALIHRPYLCLPWLQRNDTNIKRLLDLHSHRVVFSERICVREAQETAHMLHDVTSKKTLIEDFPWWQMISCLICASSILHVMQAFMSPSSNEETRERENLVEDANTCMKVFDALSTSSEAARQARDMLQNLNDTRVRYQRASEAHSDAHGSNGGYAESVGTLTTTVVPEEQPGGSNASQDDEADDQFAQFLDWNWPSEMADSMLWSSQFVETLDPFAINGQL